MSTSSNPSLPGEEVLPTHELKVWPQFFAALISGEKTFEFRKDDREPRFAVGDVLRLREWLPMPFRHITPVDRYDANGYTGRACVRRVTYVTRDSAIIPEGYCIMSIEPLSVQRDGVRDKLEAVGLAGTRACADPRDCPAPIPSDCANGCKFAAPAPGGEPTPDVVVGDTTCEHCQQAANLIRGGGVRCYTPDCPNRSASSVQESVPTTLEKNDAN